MIGERMTAGVVLSKSFGVLAERFPTFFGIIAVVHLPLIAWVAWRALADPWAVLAPGFGTRAVELFGNFILGAFASAAVVYGVFQALRGHRSSFAECMRHGARSLNAVLGVSLAVGVAVGGCLFISVVLPPFAVVFVPVALVLWVRLYVAIPSAVMERLGVSFSLSRSQELTDGRRSAVFGVTLVVWLVAGVPSFALGWFMSDSPVVVTAGGIGLDLLGATLAAVTSSVVYHDLRVDKDAMVTEDLASVFD